MASNPVPPGERKPGSVGPGTGLRISIMDEAGAHLATGQRGEVVIQGPSVVSGYENNPEANAKSYINGWFRTGDQGFLDGDGYLTLTGRIKELIVRGGEKIGPREIDEVLLSHPAVAEAAAFGVPHPTWGEEVAAASRNPPTKLPSWLTAKTGWRITSVPRNSTSSPPFPAPLPAKSNAARLPRR